MIDINCHILSGFDDGAKSLTESVAMAKEAEKQGITKIIATPELNPMQVNDPRNTIIEAVDHLNHILEQEQISVIILPGQEVLFSDNLVSELKKANVMTLNGTSDYILIKWPSFYNTVHMKQKIYELRMEGYKPIIASPERNPYFHKNPHILYQLVKYGALIQASAASIVGKESRKTQKFVDEMLESNLVHFVASNAYRRKDSLSIQEAYSRIRKSFGSLWAKQLSENSESLLTAQPIHIGEPHRLTTKRKWIFSK